MSNKYVPVFINSTNFTSIALIILVFLFLSCTGESNTTTIVIPMESSIPTSEATPKQPKQNYTPPLTKSITPTATPEVEALFLYSRGLNLFRAEKFIESVNAFSTLIKRMPNLAIAYKSRAAAYYHMEKFELAKKDIEQALLLDVDLGGAYLYLGLIHKKEGDIEIAQKNLQMAVNLIHPIRETEELRIAESALGNLNK